MNENDTYSEKPCHARQAPTFNALFPVYQVPLSNVFKLRVAAPRPDRPLVPLLDNIVEARIFYPFFHMIHNLESLAKLLAHCKSILSPPCQRFVTSTTTIVAFS